MHPIQKYISGAKNEAKKHFAAKKCFESINTRSFLRVLAPKMFFFLDWDAVLVQNQKTFLHLLHETFDF